MSEAPNTSIPAIVVVAYNRPAALRRLLTSLLRAQYPKEPVPLVISIDHGGSVPEVLRITEEMHWPHGPKRLLSRSQQMGLRRHVLACGDLAQEYGAIILLEDDLLVSPAFHHYASTMVSAYGDVPGIAGISLYRHSIHPGIHRPFVPEHNGYDVFLLQYAQSWGQCLTARMWEEFKTWYQFNQNRDLDSSNFPSYISQWPSSSWLKYHIKYVVETNKYFVYPHESLTTNCNDSGTHNQDNSPQFQVPLLSAPREYRIPRAEAAIHYDVFFERQGLGEFLDIADTDLVIDLYQQKGNPQGCRYWLTTGRRPYHIIRSFDLALRPHEANVILGASGHGIFLYDTTKSAPPPIDSPMATVLYDGRLCSKRELIQQAFHYIRRAFRAA